MKDFGRVNAIWECAVLFATAPLILAQLRLGPDTKTPDYTVIADAQTHCDKQWFQA